MEFLSSIFHPIVELMTTLVTYAFQLTQMVGYPSYGVAIILLTIVIKAVLAPLTVKQIKSMKAMQELQPRMKELQDTKTILQNFKRKWVHCTKKWVLTHWLVVCLYWCKCHS